MKREFGRQTVLSFALAVSCPVTFRTAQPAKISPSLVIPLSQGPAIATFRTLSPNYREPRPNAKLRDAVGKPGREDKIKAERSEVSSIAGIPAGDGMTGVLFSNCDASSETWKLYLQPTAAAGKLVSECLLRDAVNNRNLFKYYFRQRDPLRHGGAERGRGR